MRGYGVPAKEPRWGAVALAGCGSQSPRSGEYADCSSPLEKSIGVERCSQFCEPLGSRLRRGSWVGVLSAAPGRILYKECRCDRHCSLPDRFARNARSDLRRFRAGYSSLLVISWSADGWVCNPGIGPRVAPEGRPLGLSGQGQVPPEAKSWQLGNARSAEGGTLSEPHTRGAGFSVVSTGEPLLRSSNRKRVAGLIPAARFLFLPLSSTEAHWRVRLGANRRVEAIPQVRP